MWAIISTSNKLRFYNFKDTVFDEYEDIQFINNELGYLTSFVENHNLVVHKLRSYGIPVFVHKKEAKEQVMNAPLN